MRRLRQLIGLTLVSWAILLAIPMGRANFEVQAFHSGLTGPFHNPDPRYGLMGHDAEYFPNNTCWDAGALPDKGSLLSRYPADPSVALGLLSGPTESQVKTLDALIARHPRDASLIAARLLRSCAGLEIGRTDNPFENPNWPGPSPYAKGFFNTPASPRSDWLAFLDLANRGAALEPDNTFFDWMRMAALFALHRDEEAVRVLNSASAKNDFDNHVREQIFATLNAYQRVRPLTPVEKLRLGNWTSADFSELLESTFCITAKVWEDRIDHQDAKALTAAYSYMRLSRVLGMKSYLLRSALGGYGQVGEAILWVSLPPKSKPGYWTFPVSKPGPLPLGDTHNLAGLALALHQPGIAHDVEAERQKDQKREPLITGFVFNQTPCEPWANLAAAQERWGRILLHTIPPVLLVLFVASMAAKRWARPDDTASYSLGTGAAAGGVVILVLIAGDTLAAYTVSRFTFTTRFFLDFARSPGLYAMERPMVAGSVAVTLVLLSFSRARRWQLRDGGRGPWLANMKESLSQKERRWQLNLWPVFHAIIQGTIWVCLTATFLVVCLLSGAWDTFMHFAMPRDHGLTAVVVWTAFLVVALVRWICLPDRRDALGLVFLNLRRLAIGYVLAALLIYPITGLAILPVDWKFDQAFCKHLQLGDAAEVRQDLGL